MHPTLDFFTIQNMDFSFAPYHVVSISNFISTMQALSYIIVDRWQSYERDCHTPFFAQYDVECYFGVCLQHTSAAAPTELAVSAWQSTTGLNMAP